MAQSSRYLVTLQFDALQVDKKDAITEVIAALTPAIVENIMVAAVGDRSRGCQVSGTVTSGGGGGITITCGI